MSDKLEQCRVQLAGCSVVALGSKDRPKKGDYGWSASLQDVVNLRDKYEAAEALVRKKDARIAELEGALEQIADANDAGRHDGLPEPCPALDADTMFAIARAALSVPSQTYELERAVVETQLAQRKAGIAVGEAEAEGCPDDQINALIEDHGYALAKADDALDALAKAREGADG